jgi:outer membrane receptor protein involved in Fe transport
LKARGLRGGTAVITGPNAPGGIFNYISKNGKTDPGLAVDLNLAFRAMANCRNIADAYLGGQLRDNLYYSIGGFLRLDNGTHDAGYALNKGGQVKANLLYDYEGGSLQLTGKYLNDANTWNEFHARLWRHADRAGLFQCDLEPATCVGQPLLSRRGRGQWLLEPVNLVQNESIALGLNWRQDLGGTFKLDNKLRYSYNRSNWGAGAVLSVVSLQDPIVNILMGTAFLQPGTLNYYNANSGTLAASMQAGGSPSVFAPGYFNVTANNLPNQGIVANSNLAGNIGAYVGFGNAKSWSNQISDQLTLTGDVGNHHLALGGFIGLAKLSTDYSGAPGIGLMTMTPQPQMLTVTYTPNGSTAISCHQSRRLWRHGSAALTSYNGTQKQYSIFFGDSWKVTDKLTLEAGGRWEAINYDIRNQSWNSSPFALFPMGFGAPVGGADGNPYTLYDNGVSSAGCGLSDQAGLQLFQLLAGYRL